MASVYMKRRTMVNFAERTTSISARIFFMNEVVKRLLRNLSRTYWRQCTVKPYSSLYSFRSSTYMIKRLLFTCPTNIIRSYYFTDVNYLEHFVSTLIENNISIPNVCFYFLANQVCYCIIVNCNK